MHTNPAEFLLDLTNVDFASDRAAADKKLDEIHTAWSQKAATPQEGGDEEKPAGVKMPELSRKSKVMIPFTLLYRNFIKSYRDVFAYGIRIAMYFGMLTSLLIVSHGN